jgi:hypothetical protein
MPEEMK